MAFGGAPRRHGCTQREKRVRLDPRRGLGTDFEPIFSFQCLNSPFSEVMRPGQMVDVATVVRNWWAFPAVGFNSILEIPVQRTSP